MAFMRMREAAEFLGIKPRTLMTWKAEHGVPHFLVGGTLLFDEDELDKWVRKHRVRQSLKRDGVNIYSLDLGRLVR